MTPRDPITPLIPGQLPEAIRELGPVFVDFVKAYYEWLELTDIFRVRFHPGHDVTIGATVLVQCDPSVDFVIVGRGDDYLDVMGDISALEAGEYLYELTSRADGNGTVSLAARSVNMIGTDTEFLSDFETAEHMLVSNAIIEVTSINGDEALTVSASRDTAIANSTFEALVVVNKIRATSIERQANPLAVARDIAELSDIDTALNSYVSQLKKQYMVNFPETIAADRRLVLKHVLDLYRTKGTKRAVALLFRILFNEDIEVFEPWRYLFKASAADWYVPHYIEVSPSEFFWQLQGKAIRSQRGATGIVEGVHRRTARNQSIYILTISHLVGRFHASEYIVCDDIPEMTPPNAPCIVGSLSAISITQGGRNFELGDTLTVDGLGIDAVAKVIGIAQGSGRLSFQIVSGGFGYTVNAEVSVTGGEGTGGSFVVGDITNRETINLNDDALSDYWGLQLDSTSNGFFVAYTNANGAFANGDLVSSVATVLPLDVNPLSGTMVVGETVTGTGVSGLVVVSDSSLMKLANTSGTFTNGLELTGGTSGAMVAINTVFPTDTIEANGFVDEANSTVLKVSNVFTYSSDNWMLGNVTITAAGTAYSNGDRVDFTGGPGTTTNGVIETTNTGAISCVSITDTGTGWTSIPTVNVVTSTGSGATLTPTVEQRAGYFIYGTTLIGNSTVNAIATTVTRRTDWGFPTSTGADNLDSTLQNSLHIFELEIGTILSLARINPGSGYTSNATVAVVEPSVAALQLTDGLGGFKGEDAVITATATNANGIITAVSVTDSGVGYFPGEHLELSKSDNASLVQGRAVVDLNGEGTGYWRNNRGFVSSDQRIQDSFYWQKFSYDIAAPRMIATYEKFVKDLVHLSGFKMFGRYAVRDYQDARTAFVSDSFSQT